MKRSAVPLLVCTIGLFGSGQVIAQAEDAAAERARIANQRIQAEAQRQAAEEERRQQEQARAEAERARLESRQATAVAQREMQQLAQAEQAVVESAPTAQAATQAPASRADMNKVLEQLRTLGELRDAGYVSADEFERIKQKIIDATD